MTRRDAFKLPLLAAPTALSRAETPRGPRQYKWMPKLSDNLPDCRIPTLKWLRQMGCTYVIFQGTDEVDTAKKGYWTKEDVLPHKRNCEQMGMVLESMMIPIDFYRKARFGEAGRDREIDNVCKTIRAVGEAGVHMMEYRFWPDFYWDASVGYYHVPGRGGAVYTANDHSRVANAPPFPEIGVVSEDEMWKRCLYFLKPVVDAAEKSGVRLSMHPCDPPDKNMRGVARIFARPDGFRRLIEEIPAKANGITICQGTFTEMGVDVFAEIQYFVSRNRVNLVHFRTVRGTVPKYTEVFIDEGDIDMVQAMKVWKDSGYTGPMVSDHTPQVENDTPGGHVGRAFSLGFMRAAVQAVNTL
ncbi:MAG: mannonate dehydratase [Bryobacteraceae bacterium]